MANNLSINASINWIDTSGITKQSPTLPKISFSPASDAAINAYITATTGGVTVPLGDIATIGTVCIVNLDSTHFVTYSADGTNYNEKVSASRFIITEWNGSSIKIKADTASVKCLVMAWSA